MGEEKESLKDRFQQPAGWNWETMTNARGASLRYGMSLPAGRPRAHIVYVQGLSEYAEKNFELAHDFNRASCGFWVFDRQGQGLSGRLLKDPGKVHSESFGYDADDIARFIRTVVPKDAPVIILAHSAGGLVTMLAAHDNPDLCDGIVMTAPLLGIQNPLARNKERFWAALPEPRFLRELYAPGNIDEDMADFSSDPERRLIQDYWPARNGNLRTLGPTWGWCQEACRAIVKTRQPGYLESIEIPMAIFTGGDDVMVNNQHTFNALARLPDASHAHFEKGKHSLLMETDDIRQPIIDAVLAMVDKAAGPRPQ